MFGLEYILAFIKICIDVAFAIVSAIPFRLAWNAVVPVYFGEWVPEVLWNIPYWHFVGIILVSMFIGEIIGRITPKFVSISNSNNEKKG